MLQPRLIASALALALLGSASASASDFSKVVVFGDSLSDGGNLSLSQAPTVQPPLQFTTNPGSVTVQNVARALGLTPLTASLAGGTDYAWGGAGVLTNSPGTPAGVPTLTSQVDSYLSAGQVDGKALYSIWGGANDIFYHATAAVAGGIAQQLIAASTAGLPPAQAAAVATQINQLVASVAGVSALETADQAQLNVAAAAQQEVKLINQLQAAGVKNLLVFNLPNIGLTPEAASQGASTAASLTGLSQIYNAQLNSGLAGAGNGIIPINTYALLGEVIANPQAFGFSNVTTPACGTGSSSVRCGPAGSGLPYTYAAGTQQSYLFADGVHPTTAGHAVLGQYVVSVIQAPEYISLLGEAPLAAISAQNRAIQNQMRADSNGSDTRMFVNVDYGQQRFDGSSSSPRTSSDNVDLTVGADVRANEALSFGVALGLGQHNADFSGGGGYKMRDVAGLAYLNYQAANGLYLGGYANVGQSDFRDIDRVIQLGALRRGESGSTDGWHVGAGLTAGWWFGSQSVKTGPFVNVEWEHIRIDGYNEDGGDSTAMWFGDQVRLALISTAGWRLQGQWQVGNTMLTPYAELAWNHDSRADQREVTAGLNTMNGSFALPGYRADDAWGSANVGLSAQFTPRLSGWLGYSGRFSDDSQKYNSLNLGLKYAF